MQATARQVALKDRGHSNQRSSVHPLLPADRHDAESHHNLLHELLQELHKSDVPKDLFKESELVVARPREVVGMVQAVNEAEGIVVGV